MTVFDALTYAGNRANLADVESDPRFRFVHGDICDRAAVDEADLGHDAVVHFAAESHVDRSLLGPGRVRAHQLRGHQRHVRPGGATRGRSVRAHLHRRGVRLDRLTDPSPETDPLAPRSPYSAAKAGSDLIALGVPRDPWSAGVVTRSSNQYGPYQFPEKLIPFFVTNLLDGHHGAAVRRRAQRP